MPRNCRDSERKVSDYSKLIWEGIRNSVTSRVYYVKNMKLCENVRGRVSEFLIPLDSLLRQKHEIVRKLAGKGIRNFHLLFFNFHLFAILGLFIKSTFSRVSEFLIPSWLFFQFFIKSTFSRYQNSDTFFIFRNFRHIYQITNVFKGISNCNFFAPA